MYTSKNSREEYVNAYQSFFWSSRAPHRILTAFTSVVIFSLREFKFFRKVWLQSMPPIYHFQLCSFYLSRDLSLTWYRYDKSEIKAMILSILSYFFSLREEIEKKKKRKTWTRTTWRLGNRIETQKLNENYITVPVILSPGQEEREKKKKSNKFENTLQCNVWCGLEKEEEKEEEVLLTWQQHLFWTIAASEIIGLATIQQKCIIKRLRLAGYQERNFEKREARRWASGVRVFLQGLR